MEIKLLNNKEILAHLTSGRAVLTLKSVKTGKRFTFKVRVVPNSAKQFFVSLLRGKDNQKDFSYIGMLDVGFLHFWRTQASKVKGDAKSFLAFKCLVQRLHFERTVNNGSLRYYPSSNCGRCGRELTDPISIRLGIGPKCRGER